MAINFGYAFCAIGIIVMIISILTISTGRGLIGFIFLVTGIIWINTVTNKEIHKDNNVELTNTHLDIVEMSKKLTVLTDLNKKIWNQYKIDHNCELIKVNEITNQNTWNCDGNEVVMPPIESE